MIDKMVLRGQCGQTVTQTFTMGRLMVGNRQRCTTCYAPVPRDIAFGIQWECLHSLQAVQILLSALASAGHTRAVGRHRDKSLRDTLLARDRCGWRSGGKARLECLLVFVVMEQVKV